MNITERAAKVLQEIDAELALAETATPGPWETVLGWVADSNHNAICSPAGNNADFIAASRTGWPTTLRCLKMAIEGLCDLARMVGSNTAEYDGCGRDAAATLTTLCDQWEAGRK